ncbi:hypothetical protein AB0D46_24245 [Streptomyces sp. NPDC048383]|uniref:hypothetical protein n=1 Tax=Streptomyces sp. NPDC048383 TaxID=3155386 RepID=UPI0034260922
MLLFVPMLLGMAALFVVPLAAGPYLLTTTAWSVVERAWLHYRKDRAAAVSTGGGAAPSAPAAFGER